MGEDLDPQIGTDSRIELVWESKNLPLSTERNLKVGSSLTLEG